MVTYVTYVNPPGYVKLPKCRSGLVVGPVVTYVTYVNLPGYVKLPKCRSGPVV